MILDIYKYCLTFNQFCGIIEVDKPSLHSTTPAGTSWQPV